MYLALSSRPSLSGIYSLKSDLATPGSRCGLLMLPRGGSWMVVLLLFGGREVTLDSTRHP